MKNKGFFASVEALLSLLVLLVVIISTQSQSQGNVKLENLLILQKEHDLLKIWAKKGIPGKEDMLANFKLAFPNKSGQIRVGNKSIWIGTRKAGESIASEMVFFDSGLRETSVLIRVFK